MKKNVLALSISAALCGMGMVGSAYAVTDLGVTASVGTATSLKGNNDGIGHNLIVPYFTAQGKNATAFTLTNTTSIGKAVKVRFRGAENSDDVLDFQVFLSPRDVWTASVSQAVTGEATITTNDKSCTKPAFTAGVAQSFLTGRLSGSTNTAGTREGYIEIFNMGDIVAANGAGNVGDAITHVAGVPPCKSTGFTLLDTDTTTANLLAAPIGLALPTTGLVANWIIINTALGNSYAGQASATQALDATFAPATGNLVYWPQSSVPIGTNVSGWTADPLLAGLAPLVNANMQDLPDMSTPYISGLAPVLNTNYNSPAAYTAGNNQWASKVQASKLTASLAAVSVNNDFYNDTSGATDWVFTMPTRRYNAAVKYGTTPTIARTDYISSDAQAPGTYAPATSALSPNSIQNYFDSTNTVLNGNVICVSGITPTVYNREEGSVAAGGPGVSFSPASALPSLSFCGEAGVFAMGQTVPASGASTAVLSSGIVNVAQGVGINNYSSGWATIATPGIGGRGLPVVGFSFSKAASDPTKSYGWSQPHTVTRVAGYTY
jgi:hypothetical protein